MAAKIVADLVGHPQLQPGEPGHRHVHLLTADQCVDLHRSLEAEQGPSGGGGGGAAHGVDGDRPLVTSSGEEVHLTDGDNGSAGDEDNEDATLNVDADGNKLPRGWAAHLDEDGYEFFHHAESGESSWERPTFQAIARRVAIVGALANAGSRKPSGSDDAGAATNAVQQQQQQQQPQQQAHDAEQQPVPAAAAFVLDETAGRLIAGRDDKSDADDATGVVLAQAAQLDVLEERLNRMDDVGNRMRTRRLFADEDSRYSHALRGGGFGGDGDVDEELRATLHEVCMATACDCQAPCGGTCVCDASCGCVAHSMNRLVLMLIRLPSCAACLARCSPVSLLCAFCSGIYSAVHRP